MVVYYFRAGATYRAQLDFELDEEFMRHLTNHESVWIVPGTAEDFD
jgi:hypothetical protein